MKVNIVIPNEQDMTLDKFQSSKYKGVMFGSGERRAIILNGAVYGFMACQYMLHITTDWVPFNVLIENNSHLIKEYHVFTTSNELFEWLAE